MRNRIQANLTTEEVEEYKDLGFLIVEDFFNNEEIESLSRHIPDLNITNSPNVVLEKSGEIRSVFYESGDSKIVDALCRLNRLVKSAEAILQSSVYMHQVKVNIKKALSGDVWEWHQDYIFWNEKDGMPTSNVLNVGIFLDEANEFNGPLFFIPESHKDGLISKDMYHVNIPESTGDYTNDLSANLSFILKKEVLKKYVSQNGMVSAKGKAGTVVFFHGNIFHSSSNNLSPYDRKLLILTYNSTENRLKDILSPRPNFLANRDFTSIQAINDDALKDVFNEIVS